MTYEETIEYLYQRLPMFSRIGAAALKKDLHNTIELCAYLGDPHRKIRTIHIAGTNGKGSVSHMLAAVLQSAGYRTGLYTSPHLRDFRERIRVDGEMVSRSFVTRFTREIDPMIDRISPSFFEITVAMAFSWFAEQQVDVAVIETGLGGRLDSTNVITPEISVITNIGWDHMQILGDTLQAIASEKAGIIKPGVPVVVGETDPGTASVFRSGAEACGSTIRFADNERVIDGLTGQHPYLLVDTNGKNGGSPRRYRLDLPGHYQAKNLLTVLEALDQLRMKGWELPEAAVAAGLANVKGLTGLHGRWETVRENPRVVLDVAHNEPGMRQLGAQLEQERYDRLHVVLGMVKDKDLTNVLPLLPKDARYYFTRAGIPRALPVEELAEKAREAGLSGTSFPDVHAALDEALRQAAPADLILVCGSVFLVGEVDPARIGGGSAAAQGTGQ
jgi:dihydrofolate synthase/folylpolyglutamate synthase